jgi:hypothetical protein
VKKAWSNRLRWASAGANKPISPRPGRSHRTSMRAGSGHPPPGNRASSAAYPLGVTCALIRNGSSARQSAGCCRAIFKERPVYNPGCDYIQVGATERKSKWLRRPPGKTQIQGVQANGRLEDLGSALATEPARPRHPAVPATPDYGRAAIVFGAAVVAARPRAPALAAGVGIEETVLARVRTYTRLTVTHLSAPTVPKPQVL